MEEKNEMKTYYAVIFTSQRTEQDEEGYDKMAEKIDVLAQRDPDFCALKV